MGGGGGGCVWGGVKRAPLKTQRLHRRLHDWTVRELPTKRHKSASKLVYSYMSIIQPTWIRFHAGFMLTKELQDSLIKVCADRLWGKLFFTDKSTLADFGVVLGILKTDWLSYHSMFTRHAVQLCHLLRWAIHWSCSFRFLQSRHQYLRNVNRCPVIDSWSVAKTVSFQH